MKKIMLITLILLLFISCSAVNAENNASDEIIAHDTTNDSLGLEASELNTIENSADANDLETDDSELGDSGEGEYVDASDAYAYLNAFRTEENVWYWNSDDVTQSHVNTNDTVWLKPLERDADLENTARIRAKELSESFSHYRPDGTICFTIFPENLMDYGENIAYGYENCFDVTEGWKETTESYEGQGHRRNMLHASYNYVGIAGYKVNGTIYWVQNFGCRLDPKDIESKFNFENNTASPEFSIEVPKYASGDFELRINGNLIATKSISNGKANITVSGLSPGTYEAYLYYSGDYNCKFVEKTVSITVPDYENPNGTLTFNDLNTHIQMSSDEIRLENDYAFNSNTDSSFEEGIIINKYLTIDGQGHVIDAKNLARIFKINSYGVTFKNICMVNGNTNFTNPNEKKYYDDSSYGPTSYYYSYTQFDRNGGAISASYYPISVINSTFSNNEAENGGAIHSFAMVTVENSTFTKNRASDKGGAIYSTEHVTATNTNFTDNYALEAGGAVYTKATVEATNSIFKNNNNLGIFTKEFQNNNCEIISDEYMALFANATEDNGIVTLNKDYYATGTVLITASNVIIDGNGYTIDAKNRSRLFYILGDNVTIKNIRFINGNSTTEGGAIYANSTLLTIIGSTFENNLAQTGGVVYGNSTDIIISDCSFKNNELKDFSGSEITEGGVICTRTGTVSISNARFENNTAYYGGVIHTDTGRITIRDSYFENNKALLYGGGVTHTEANVSVSNSDFINNYAERYGGSIFVYGDGELYIEDSTFKNCTSNHYGGAISAATETVIINSSFTDSFATDHGGSIASWGNLTVSDSNFTGSTADVGGAIFNYAESNSSISIIRSNFINNTQRTNGVLYITNNIIVRDSNFINNHATDGTTGAIECHKNITVIGSTFINNTAKRSWGDSAGGAITNYGESLHVEDCLFENNSATRGGAVATYTGTATVDNSRFINNSATFGGGIYNHFSGSTIIASNSVFENNSAEDGGAMIRSDADNCTFIKNRATNIGSAMYGESNTAKDCTFSENLDYNEGPAWEVTSTDCTFNDNIVIINAGFEEYYLDSIYYQGDIMFMALRNYKDYSQILNETVTLRAYKNNVLAGEFKYVSGNGWIVNITEGNYTFEFSIDNPKYAVTPLNVTITIMKKEIADVLIEIKNDTFSNPTVINITSNLDGTMELYLGETYLDYFSVFANEMTQRTYNYMSAGNYTLKVIMAPANYHFDSRTFTKDFTIFKKETTIELNVKDVCEDQYVTVNVKNSDAGMITVTVGDHTQTLYAYDEGETTFDFGLLDCGTYTVTATYEGNENYQGSSSSKTLHVTSKISQDDIKVSLPENDSEEIVINLPSDAKGKVTLSIAGESYEADVIDGKATVKLPNLTGNTPYTITYSGDEKYSGFDMTGSLNRDSAAVKVTPEAEIPSLDDGVSITRLPSDATGTVTLTINGKNYEFEVFDGIAYVIMPEMEDGTYDYTITYSGDDKYLPFTQRYVLTVVNPVDPVITASNVKVTYNAGSYYTIKVYGTDGKPANTTVKITGKISKTITAANGVAKFKVTQVPGTYKITIAALGISLTKTITVKHLVTLKSVTVKKSAKKLVLQATLGKVNGKYLKSKKVTFKFNGKTYKAKTNSKGIAKVTIKSSVLKKLKVGKKVTYQATYLKDTVKKTVKVKK
ncbi:MAG: hypothetical protein E7Z83_02090 [Methanobrevibacter sp.]|nr:Ig-like domain repeat protein [Methanobrevibacter sp.]MBE6489629.1 hypothetical protein [Methanobrevibacter sp.]